MATICTHSLPAQCSCHRARQGLCALRGHLQGCTSSPMFSRQIQQQSALSKLSCILREAVAVTACCASAYAAAWRLDTSCSRCWCAGWNNLVTVIEVDRNYCKLGHTPYAVKHYQTCVQGCLICVERCLSTLADVSRSDLMHSFKFRVSRSRHCHEMLSVKQLSSSA